MNLRMPSSAVARGWLKPRNSNPVSAATSGGLPAAKTAARSALDWLASLRYVAETLATGPRFRFLAGSDAVPLALLDQPPRIAGDKRDDRLHRIDPDRPGEQARVRDEQPPHPVERPEAVNDAPCRVVAHPGGAHQVDREQLHRLRRHRPGEQVPGLGGTVHRWRPPDLLQDTAPT